MREMVFRDRRRKKDVTLNVTSLIDVLFLLLIFFMLTGTFKRVGELELQLPESSSSIPAEGSPAAQVELVATEDGRLLLDGEEVALPELGGRLDRLHRADPTARIMIQAEGGVRHEEVVRLLDLVREAGFPGVGIGTHIRRDAQQEP